MALTSNQWHKQCLYQAKHFVNATQFTKSQDNGVTM